MDKFTRHLARRIEDKPPTPRRGVRQLQAGISDLPLTKENQVEVERTRGPVTSPHSTVRCLDLQKTPQELGRRQFTLKEGR